MSDEEREDYYLPYFVEKHTNGDVTSYRAVCKECWFPTTWFRVESSLKYAYSQHYCKDSEEWD